MTYSYTTSLPREELALQSSHHRPLLEGDIRIACDVVDVPDDLKIESLSEYFEVERRIALEAMKRLLSIIGIQRANFEIKTRRNEPKRRNQMLVLMRY